MITHRSNRVRRRVLAAGAATVALLMVAACGGSESGAEETSHLIGFPALTSGPSSFAGVPLTQGARLAADEINETAFLGEGTTVELQIDDINDDPARAISLYQEYVSDGASGVLCCGASETGALAPLIKEGEVPGVVTSSNRAEAVEVPHVFSSVLLPAAEGGMYDSFVDAIVPDQGYETAVMVVNGDLDPMVADGEVWTAALERNGIEILETVSIAAADTNHVGPATEVAAVDPDVVVSSMLGGSTAQLARALRERGFDKRILTSYGASGPTLFETAGHAMEGVTFPTPFAATHPRNEMAKSFVTAYEEEFGEQPDLFAAQGYTAMWLMAHGLKGAGSTDPALVKEALASVEEYETVYGSVTVEEGQSVAHDPGIVLEWEADGSLRELELG